MHPEITATWAASCPKCGMTVRPTGTGRAADPGDAASAESAGAEHHMHAHHKQHEYGGHAHGTAQGIEWEDDMVEVNRMTTPANMR